MADEIEWIYEDIAPDCKLPGDVIVSILTNLPVKSLLKFKAVSKPWCCLISSSSFFKLHFHRQSLLATNCLMLLKEHQDFKCGLLDLSQDSNFTPADYYEGEDILFVDDDAVLILEISPSLPPEQGHLLIMDSCNGLVCLGVGNDKLFCISDLILWNPATKRHRFIDIPNGVDLQFFSLGLCYVDAINDFKILLWKNSQPTSTVDTPNLYVYSLSSDSWVKLHFDDPKIDIHLALPTSIGGCMHWFSNTCRNDLNCTCTSASEVVAFDVTNGALSWFHLPGNCGHHLTKVKQTLDIGGCLSIVVLSGTTVQDDDERGDGVYEVWVMEEYGVEGSWVKRFSIQEEEFSHFGLPLISWIYGEIVVNSMYDDSKVAIFYDPYSKEKIYVELTSYRVLALFNYVESLASVGN